MVKIVKAVQPYIHPEHLNFKLAAFKSWAEQVDSSTSKIQTSHFPWRWLHGIVYRFEFPEIKWLTNVLYRITEHKQEALLMFVEPVSITFDTFPYYATHEITPFIWDCWPCYYNKMEKWLRKHNVRTAIFTSKQEMEEMRRRIPEINYIHCPEAVDTSLYNEGKPLKNRSIDLLEFGRSNRFVFEGKGLEMVNHVCTKEGNDFIYTNKQLYDVMSDSKIAITLPCNITHPQKADGIETLTQRYWECMLSRIVMIGHAPKELTDLIGYNPCIEWKKESLSEQIFDTIAHIENYQGLVDKNLTTAIRLGSWESRMKDLCGKLMSMDYYV